MTEVCSKCGREGTPQNPVVRVPIHDAAIDTRGHFVDGYDFHCLECIKNSSICPLAHDVKYSAGGKTHCLEHTCRFYDRVVSQKMSPLGVPAAPEVSWVCRFDGLVMGLQAMSGMLNQLAAVVMPQRGVGMRVPPPPFKG